MNAPEEIRAYYDDFGEVYEAVWDEQIHMGLFADTDDIHAACQAMNGFLAHKAGLKKGMRILDFGCGQGGADRFLVAEYGASVTGIDISQKQIEKASLRARQAGLQDRISYAATSLEGASLAEGYFDAIWAQEAFSYSADKPAAMRRFFRLLRPGGILMLEDIALLNSESKEEVVRLFGGRTKFNDLPTGEEYRRWIKESGFSLRETLDLSLEMAKTYAAVNRCIEENRAHLKAHLSTVHRKALAANFGFPFSQALAEDGKLGCLAFFARKPLYQAIPAPSASGSR